MFFLRNLIKLFMKLDENSNKDKKFCTIKSLYFDSLNNDVFNEKVDGIYVREKLVVLNIL